MRPRSCLAVLSLSLAGCVDAGPFRCESAAECRDDGMEGACEADGFCSFPDPSCGSGRRYGEHARPGLGGECASTAAAVPAPAGPAEASAGGPRGPLGGNLPPGGLHAPGAATGDAGPPAACAPCAGSPALIGFSTTCNSVSFAIAGEAGPRIEELLEERDGRGRVTGVCGTVTYEPSGRRYCVEIVMTWGFFCISSASGVAAPIEG